ncbi:hypothetical protein E2562_005603 [Oryza meyeriana var. granulata]|uniref:Uncharacterized protein n=1 Tax=Oryza meyeriana var. granulata TaxID=110450 RepID=A0A6G1F408_9ORYZ|nr:hypothetical protein E2562_005603 [Oryza meyeriana var. granulata]
MRREGKKEEVNNFLREASHTLPNLPTSTQGLSSTKIPPVRRFQSTDLCTTGSPSSTSATSYNSFADAIHSPADALDILPITLQLLFDACVEACTRFLEAVPWLAEEDARVLELAPLLPADEAADLLARITPPPSASPSGAEGEVARSPSEAMLHGLIHSAIHGQIWRWRMRKGEEELDLENEKRSTERE